ncbi:MAG: hypothetical protein P1V51_09850 [Deltaproteobacteria bacterium]|nr:hypothetical protein [Deltaproteobacteria bacterium]
MNLPTHDFLSAPLWLLTTLHILTLTLHFVAMNFVLGGVAIMIWGKWTDRWENPVVQTFVKAFPSVMAATVTLGVAPLLFAQLVYGQVIYSAAVTSAWFFLAIVPVVILGYYSFYGAALFDLSGERKSRLLVVALTCLVYVSLVYVTVFAMAESPEKMAAAYANSPGGWVIYPVVGEWFFRWAHMFLGALTVGGYFVGLLGRENEEAFKIGKTFYLWGLIGASLAGLAYVGMLGDHLKPFMQSSGIWVLTVAVVLSLGSAHLFFKKKFVPSGALIFLSLLGMVITRHILRLVKLREVFDPASIRVDAQWSLAGLFILCFVIMLGLLFWMVKLFRTTGGAAHPRPTGEAVGAPPPR